MNVAIVTDSTAYLPAEVVARHGIRVVPLHVVLDGTERDEGVDVDPGQVAAALRAHRRVSTSRPTPSAFLEAYEAAAEAGADEVVSVHISADMSGTVDSAVLAARHAPVPVEVVDSRSMGMAMGYAVLAAAEAAERGEGARAVAGIARSRARATKVWFCVDTLEHLHRGGRIGKASALLGSALAIKPLLTLEDGHIELAEKVRTSARAVARMEDLAVGAAEAAGGDACVELAVHHIDAPARATELAGRLHERLPGAPEPMLVELGPVVGAHVGPGTLAVVVAPRPGRGD
ncbi:DegV family protein [Oryzihumus leptocrescens]|uniref:DegV family protein with EDD domain n=1 Tax=Oryzihumus leptocrescens TaxID=297536 RepID=A0A542ZKX5_9MICO|nr:DegV family protein [Oryzihumus leptocrescens]TQL61004.1 DegV family protein with EDD domain [Oryzihumus leptocrescens]